MNVDVGLAILPGPREILGLVGLGLEFCSGGFKALDRQGGCLLTFPALKKYLEDWF